MIFLVLISILVTLLTGIYLWAKYVTGYWARQKIPYVPAQPLIGNLGPPLKHQKGFAQLFNDLYHHPNGANSPVVGIHMCHKPSLLIKNTDIIKNIMIKDFNSFSDRFSTSDIKTDKLGAFNLFFSKNPLWRAVRLKLTATFTTARMKQMFPLIKEIGVNLDKEFDKPKPIVNDMREVAARYATDIIASCAFGVDAKSVENPNSDFRRHDWEGDMLLAQASIFFSAGFETTSLLISFTLLELAWQPDLQTRLREEIKEALIKNNGNLSYDVVMGLEYLHMVCEETLRLYPAVIYLDRECTDPKGYSLKPYVDFTIPYRMPIFVPLYAMHHDPQYFPDPESYNPERFSEANKENIIPYTYMPFGIGPHNCIGERFGLMSGKNGLINLLKTHRFEVCDKTIQRNALDKRTFLTTPEGGTVYLKAVKDPLL